jgi:uncharacterized protein (TIRG00374 family)
MACNYSLALRKGVNIMECPTEPPATTFGRKTLLMPLIGIAAFVIYIYIFQVDIIAIFSILQTANPFFYSLAILLSLVEIFFFSLSWRTLVNFLSIKLSVIKSNLLVWSGIFVDILVPAESVSGEALRVYLIAKEQGNNTCGRVVASLVTHRILGMTMNVVVLIMGMSLLYTEGQIDSLVFNLVLFLAVVISSGLILMILLSFKEKWSLRVIGWLVRFGKAITPKRWKDRISHIGDEAIRMAESFHDSMVEFRKNPKALVISFGYLILTWIFAVSIPYFVFVSLSPTREPVAWGILLITSAIVVAVKSIPVGIPFEVGLPEITMTAMFTSLGINGALSATATILTRIITLWFRFLVSFIAQQLLQLKPFFGNRRK